MWTVNATAPTAEEQQPQPQQQPAMAMAERPAPPPEEAPTAPASASAAAAAFAIPEPVEAAVSIPPDADSEDAVLIGPYEQGVRLSPAEAEALRRAGLLASAEVQQRHNEEQKQAAIAEAMSVPSSAASAEESVVVGGSVAMGDGDDGDDGSEKRRPVVSAAAAASLADNPDGPPRRFVAAAAAAMGVIPRLRPAPAGPLGEDLPPCPGTVYGTSASGHRLAVRQCPKPARRMMIQALVRGGSVRCERPLARGEGPGWDPAPSPEAVVDETGLSRSVLWLLLRSRGAPQFRGDNDVSRAAAELGAKLSPLSLAASSADSAGIRMTLPLPNESGSSSSAAAAAAAGGGGGGGGSAEDAAERALYGDDSGGDGAGEVDAMLPGSRAMRLLTQALAMLRAWTMEVEIDQETLEQEREAMTAHIVASYTGPDNERNAQAAGASFVGTGYEHHHNPDVGALRRRLATVTAEELNAYKRRWWNPANMLIVVGGDFSTEDNTRVLQTLKDIFAPNDEDDPRIFETEIPSFPLIPFNKAMHLEGPFAVCNTSPNQNRQTLLEFQFLFPGLVVMPKHTLAALYFTAVQMMLMDLFSYYMQREEMSRFANVANITFDRSTTTLGALGIQFVVAAGKEVAVTEGVAEATECFKSLAWIRHGPMGSAYFRLKNLSNQIYSKGATPSANDKLSDRVKDLSDEFLHGEHALGEPVLSDCMRRILPGMSAAGVARSAQSAFVWPNSRLVATTAVGGELRSGTLLDAVERGAARGRALVAEAEATSAALGADDVDEEQGNAAGELDGSGFEHKVDRAALQRDAVMPLKVDRSPDGDSSVVYFPNGSVVVFQREPEGTNGPLQLLIESSGNNALLAAWGAHGGCTSGYLSDCLSSSIAIRCMPWAGGVTAKDMPRLLLENMVNVENLEIGISNRSVTLGGLPGSLENLLQLGHMWFTQPAGPGEWTREMLKQWLDETMPVGESAHDLETDDNMSLRVDLQRRYNNVSLLWPLVMQETRLPYSHVDPEESRRFFQRCFSSPDEFRFVLAGPLPRDEYPDSVLIKLFSQYIGTIPVPPQDDPTTFPEGYDRRGTEQTLQLLNPRHPQWLIDGNSFDVIYLDHYEAAPRANVEIALEVPPCSTRTEYFFMMALMTMVRIRVTRVLGDRARSVKGNLQAMFSVSLPGQMYLSFAAAPEDVEACVFDTVDDMMALCEHGANAADIRTCIRRMQLDEQADNESPDASAVSRHASMHVNDDDDGDADDGGRGIGLASSVAGGSDEAEAAAGAAAAAQGREMTPRQREAFLPRFFEHMAKQFIYPQHRSVVVTLPRALEGDPAYAHLHELGDPRPPLLSGAEFAQRVGATPRNAASLRSAWGASAALHAPGADAAVATAAAAAGAGGEGGLADDGELLSTSSSWLWTAAWVGSAASLAAYMIRSWRNNG